MTEPMGVADRSALASTTAERPGGASGAVPHLNVLGPLAERAGYRRQYRACFNCRYRRVHHTVATVSECLLLGRTMGITTVDKEYLLDGWDRERLCDEWKRRPGTWKIRSDGCDNNPHWVDPYISRATLTNLRERLCMRLGIAARREDSRRRDRPQSAEPQESVSNSPGPKNSGGAEPKGGDDR